MGLTWYNRNYVRTPIWWIFVLNDRSFLYVNADGESGPRLYCLGIKPHILSLSAPGKGTVHAEFKIDEATLNDIQEHTASGEKIPAKISC